MKAKAAVAQKGKEAEPQQASAPAFAQAQAPAQAQNQASVIWEWFDDAGASPASLSLFGFDAAAGDDEFGAGRWRPYPRDVQDRLPHP